MKIMNSFRMLGIGVVAVALAAACAPTGNTVRATLTEMAITLDHASIPGGKVTFDVKNSGTVVHELVVIKTSVAEGQLAADPTQTGKVVEDGNIGETGDLAAGQAKQLMLDLGPGNYTLICNQPGHYAAGMHVPFTVK